MPLTTMRVSRPRIAFSRGLATSAGAVEVTAQAAQMQADMVETPGAIGAVDRRRRRRSSWRHWRRILAPSRKT